MSKKKKQSVQERNEIKAWLKSKDKDFDAGFELFVRYSHNRALALQLARKRRLSKLEYELEKIAAREFIKESRVWPIAPVMKAADRNQEHQETESFVEETGKRLVVTDEIISYEDLPEEMKKLYDENRETYKLMRAVHEKMKQALKDGERAELREELVKMDDKIAANWKVLDEWFAKSQEEDTGDDEGNDEGSIESREDLPAEETPVEPEKKPAAIDVAKDLNACRSYLSRNLGKLARLEGKKREVLMAKIAERVATLQKHNAEISEATRAELVKLGMLNEN